MSNITSTSKAITANGQSISWEVQDWGTAVAYCTGTFSTVNVTFEVSLDNTNWFAIQVVRTNANTIETTTGNLSAAPAYGWEISLNAVNYFRIRSTAWTSGTQNWTVAFTAQATESAPAIATHAVTGSGTFISGGVAAHDAAISGNPVRIGARALTANYAAVSTGDTSDLITSIVGQLITKDFSIPDLDWQYAAASGGIVNTTDVVAKTAAGAGIRNYVTGIQLRNSNATATEFVIKDGATVIWRTQLPASMAASMEVPFPTPLRGTANTAINIACITTGAAVYANLQGYAAGA